jgi:hypothetical protein
MAIYHQQNRSFRNSHIELLSGWSRQFRVLQRKLVVLLFAKLLG